MGSQSKVRQDCRDRTSRGWFSETGHRRLTVESKNKRKERNDATLVEQNWRAQKKPRTNNQKPHNIKQLTTLTPC
jgi:hypothetical protein